jgi:hypothetical protein
MSRRPLLKLMGPPESCKMAISDTVGESEERIELIG